MKQARFHRFGALTRLTRLTSLTSLTSLIGLALASQAAAAQSDFKFSAYGTLGLTHMSSDKADFKGAFADVGNGAGRTGSLRATPDSRVAVQLDFSASDQLDFVAQLMSRQNRFNNYEPSLEALNVKYKFSSATSLRVGRIAHPFFLASDSRLIGYANTFARGPSEVYNQSQIYNSDVIQLAHRMPLGGGNASFSFGTGQARYGNPSSNRAVADEDKGKFRKLMFGEVSWEMGSLTLRAGYNTGRNDFNANAAAPLYAMAAMVSPALAEELSLTDKRVSFTGLGLIYDPGDFLVQAEYTMTRWGLGGKSIVPNADAFYVLGGMRTGSLTPYALYAKRKTDAPRVVSEFVVPQLNAVFTGYAASTVVAQHTLAAGLRWDFRPGMALKLQWDRIKIDSAGGNSYLTNANPANRPARGDRFNVLGLNLDFVF